MRAQSQNVNATNFQTAHMKPQPFSFAQMPWKDCGWSATVLRKTSLHTMHLYQNRDWKLRCMYIKSSMCSTQIYYLFTHLNKFFHTNLGIYLFFNRNLQLQRILHNFLIIYESTSLLAREDLSLLKSILTFYPRAIVEQTYLTSLVRVSRKYQISKISRMS